MGLFDGSNTEQVLTLQTLQNEVAKLRESNKKGSAQVAELNQQIADLKDKLAAAAAQNESSKAAVLKARKRQKNSVERANRFKKRAANIADSSASVVVGKL